MASIHENLSKIINAVFGRDIRQALHDGLDAINKETESTTSRQDYLDRKYDEQIKNMTVQDPSSAEIVDMRVAANGKTFEKAGDRLNYFDEQLDTKTQQLEFSKASKTEVDIERKRIDNLAKLGEGSTTGDAELIDGRVGADGITYINIGEAIRTQLSDNNNNISKVNNNILKAIETSKIDVINLKWKKGFINSSGQEVESTTNLITNTFYNVDTNKIYTIKATKSNGLIARCYDSNGTFIESVSFVGNADPSVVVTKEWSFNYPLVRFVITTNNAECETNENNIKITYDVESIFAKKEDIPTLPKKPYVSPIDFGAKGDGTCDDSNAIQQCIDYCIENDVKLMCEKSYTFVISKTITFIGKDYTLTTGDGLVTRDVKRIATDFDFNNSTFYITGGIISDSSHVVSYNNVSYPCAIYYYNSDNFSLNGCIKNLRINCRKVAMIPIYCEQIRKTRFENIDIQGLATVGFWLGFSSGSMFNNIVIKSDVKGTTGFYVTSSDCHFTDIFMVDVTIPFDVLACMNYFTRVHPFILTPSFISGSRMFKCRSFDFDGTYKGSVTMILTDCYCDTFEFCFDISDRKDHRIISKGLTYINNTTIMDNFFKQNGTTGLYLVKTGRNVGYASKVKIMNSFMSGFVKDDIIHTYLSDTGEITLDEFSVASNINTEPPALI